MWAGTGHHVINFLILVLLRPRRYKHGRRMPPVATKAAIPKALREQVWLRYTGRVYERKCYIPWCQNVMSVFDFHVGHDVPESLGGATDIANLRPICARCNLSMGSSYTVQEWSRLSTASAHTRTWAQWLCCGFLQHTEIPQTR
jgi:5-methylcytosine-specific restriction endonuclease McrA